MNAMADPGQVAGLRFATSACGVHYRCPEQTGMPMPHHTSLIAILCVGFVLAFVFGMAAPAAAAVAAGRLPDRRHRRRAVHPGLRRRPVAGAATGRDRRDPADVRRRPAFLAEGPDGGQVRSRIPGAIVQIAVATLLGWGLAWCHGLADRARHRVRLLAGRRPAPWCCCARWRSAACWKPRRGKIAVGWLIVEDLACVLALVLMPVLAERRSTQTAARAITFGAGRGRASA